MSTLGKRPNDTDIFSIVSGSSTLSTWLSHDNPRLIGLSVQVGHGDESNANGIFFSTESAKQFADFLYKLAEKR